MAKQVRQFGTWPSPLDARAMSIKARLPDVQWSGDGETLAWLEGRGKGTVLVAQQGRQAPRDLTPEGAVRTGVGYGGGDFTVQGDNAFYAGADGHLYRVPLAGGPAQPLTPAFGRLASPVASPDDRWVAYVHTYAGADVLAVADAQGRAWPRVLASGTDFVMQPAWHPDGTQIVYVTWDVPNMPWDGTTLRLATLEADSAGPWIASSQVVAGGPRTAIFQPAFSSDGRWLAYVGDATGWGQLYVMDLHTGEHTQLTGVEADHATPAWIQGMRTYGWSHDSRALYAIRSQRGFSSLWRVEVETGQATPVPRLDDYTYLEQIAVSPLDDSIAVVASSSVLPSRIVTLRPGEASGPVVRKRGTPELIPVSALARAEAVSWSTTEGETAHGLYYAPTSERFTGVGTPPLIVAPHSGPTSQARAEYAPTAQFFATRGYAVLEVNYRGSSGYGRAYQDRLNGNWGLYDVDDCASGARALVERGLADPQRLVIMGGSAGGFTVLMSLIRHPGFYRAGICAYGVSNQFTLAADATFKFEAHYNDTLLGPLPDAAELYRERSPVFHAERITDPVLIFQGSDDEVVPPAQSEAIVAALRARHVPHEYHVFEGEGHGFRKPETIEAYYETILRFLKQYAIYI